MTITKIDSYEVIYSANSFAPRIALKSGTKPVGQLVFKPNGVALPPDSMASGLVNLYYHLADYQNAVDLLRNEAPMYLWFNGAGGGFENGIKTTEEAVGDGERK